MMGGSNYRYSVEHRLSHLHGELKSAREEVLAIEEQVAKLSSLHERIASLQKAIAAAETLMLHDNPEWQPNKIVPVQPRVWKSAFKPGELTRIALTLLRESGDWQTPRDLAITMLVNMGQDPDDRRARTQLSNSVGTCLKKHEGTLVESQGDYPKQWRVIRQA